MRLSPYACPTGMRQKKQHGRGHQWCSLAMGACLHGGVSTLPRLMPTRASLTQSAEAPTCSLDVGRD